MDSAQAIITAVLPFLTLAAGIGALWWRVNQHDDKVADEARRQQNVEDRLDALEFRQTSHADADKQLGEKVDEVLKEVREIRERVIKIETRIESD